jgi:hypothetical protein
MKLINPNRTLLIAAAALMMSTYQLSPLPAWACTATSSGDFAYSSNTGPTSVTVCAKSVSTSRTVATTPKVPAAKTPVVKTPVAKTPMAKVTPKPTPKPAASVAKTVSLLTPIKTGVPIALQPPSVKPAPKPAPKPVASQTSSKTLEKSVAPSPVASVTTTAGEVSFTPTSLSVSASDSAAEVGQSVTFWTNAATHYKTGLLLGKVTDVRFTPIQTVWNSDRGHSGVGASITLAFYDAGTAEVSASVTYSVAYQIAGASGWVDGGEITVSDSVSLSIEEVKSAALEASQSPAKVVKLVGKNCFSRPSVFGCSP